MGRDQFVCVKMATLSDVKGLFWSVVVGPVHKCCVRKLDKVLSLTRVQKNETSSTSPTVELRNICTAGLNVFSIQIPVKPFVV